MSPQSQGLQALYNPDCQSFLSNLSKIKILQNQNDKYITAPYLSRCVSFSDFNRIKLPDDAKNYIYNNSSDTWKVEKDNTGQVLFNKYRRDNEANGAFLRYSGDNLFVNGQFVFDKVENVFLHNELDLFVVKFADGNYDCVDLNSDKPKLVGLPVREYSSLNEYEYAFKNKKAVDNFVYKDNKVFINNLDLAISDSELGYVPNKHFNEQSVFKTYDERYWLTLPNSVVWIEGSKAWKSKLKKYRRENK